MDKRRPGGERHRHRRHSGHVSHGGHSGRRRLAPGRRLPVRRRPFRNRRAMLSLIFAGFIAVAVLSLILFVLLPMFIDGKVIKGNSEKQYTVMESIVHEMNTALGR